MLGPVDTNAAITLKCKTKRKAGLLFRKPTYLKTQVPENPWRSLQNTAKVAGEKPGVCAASVSTPSRSTETAPPPIPFGTRLPPMSWVRSVTDVSKLDSAQDGGRGVRRVDVQHDLRKSKLSPFISTSRHTIVRRRLAKSGQIPHKMWGQMWGAKCAERQGFEQESIPIKH